MTINTGSILTGDEKLDKHLEIGPDPQSAMCTGTGHSRAHVKHDPAAPAQKMTLKKVSLLLNKFMFLPLVVA
jgi:hypothetical protein